ncbi:WD40-repeat-containing domain protein [Infundibulicybe gibba]|nr:WD40-repeat-containing domain protein [Infundibulicybe gibba]
MHIASGSADKSMRVWDAATGTEIASFQGHDNIVYSVAYSPDGKHIGSASLDKSVKVWNIVTGAEVASLQGHSDGVYSVAYSPDGKHIASGSADRSMKVWDAATSREIVSLYGHSDIVCSVAYSPNSRHIVSGSIDRAVRVWNKSSYMSQTLDNSNYSPTLVVRPDSWVYQTASQNNLLLWVPSFLSILHTTPQLIISQSSQANITLHDMVHGSKWTDITNFN